MSLEAICKVECEDCGEFYIVDRKFVSIFVINKEYVTATQCPNCNVPIIDNIDSHTARLLSEKGVKALSFNDGKEKKIVRRVENES